MDSLKAPLVGPHRSVLLEEVLSFAPEQPARILDVTLGAGGHSAALLERFPSANLWGTDRDGQALAIARARLASWEARIRLTQAKFSEVPDFLESQAGRFDYILADLGVSSMQLDQAARGFSFMQEGPLDMRMTPEAGLSAAEFLASVSLGELETLLKNYGEERFARKIAQAIVAHREKEAFQSTRQLAEFIFRVVPRKFHQPGFHPATLTFQALRIEVNRELEEIEALLGWALDWLNPGGRLAIIAFHSLEDRRVKQQFRLWEKPCRCPTHLPKCVCGLLSSGQVLTRHVVIPTEAEMQSNPRSRSAKLRVFEVSGKNA